MTDQHFPIRIDPFWRPLLLVGAATRENSYLELDEQDLAVQFGWFFGRTIPRSEIESAERRDWPLWMGVGWRTNIANHVGLIGSRQGVVELKLKHPVRVWGVVRCTRIAVSLEQPDEFLAALGLGGG